MMTTCIDFSNKARAEEWYSFVVNYLYVILVLTLTALNWPRQVKKAYFLYNLIKLTKQYVSFFN